MAIVIPPKGETQRAALAGQIIGGYKKAQEEVARAERIQSQLRSIAAQKEMGREQDVTMRVFSTFTCHLFARKQCRDSFCYALNDFFRWF